VRILVTRPQPEGERTAAALRERGHVPLLAPLLTIDAIADARFGEGPWSALLLTSGNAARALSAHPQMHRILPLPVLAVGRQTAAAAWNAGFASVQSADGDASDLAKLVAARFGGAGRLLYLAGNDRARDLGADLAAHGTAVETVVNYRAVAATALPQPARDALLQREVDSALHFSRRTAEIFLNCAQAAGLTGQIRLLTHYCLSNRVAEALTVAGLTDVHVAPSPEEPALLGLLPSA
jgi:uroporphyrinogen-III synthase